MNRRLDDSSNQKPIRLADDPHRENPPRFLRALDLGNRQTSREMRTPHDRTDHTALKTIAHTSYGSILRIAIRRPPKYLAFFHDKPYRGQLVNIAKRISFDGHQIGNFTLF